MYLGKSVTLIVCIATLTSASLPPFHPSPITRAPLLHLRDAASPPPSPLHPRGGIFSGLPSHQSPYSDPDARIALYEHSTPTLCTGPLASFCETVCYCTAAGAVACNHISRDMLAGFKVASRRPGRAMLRFAAETKDECAPVCGCGTRHLVAPQAKLEEQERKEKLAQKQKEAGGMPGGDGWIFGVGTREQM